MQQYVLQAITAVQDTTGSVTSSGCQGWIWFDWLALVANIGSVVGLLFTIYGAFRVWKLKKKYDFLLHGHQLARKLTDLEAELFDYLGSHPGTQHQSMKAELNRGMTVLENLLKRLNDDERSDFSSHQTRINLILDGGNLAVGDLWDIYSELTQVNERAEDLIRTRTLEA